MYTTARLGKHPIHPMLVGFPIALYTATVVTIIVHIVTRDPFWYRVALWSNLSGVVMAAAAALPGLVDLIGLPAHSRARGTGLRHAACNVFALALFASSAVILCTSWAHHVADAAPLYSVGPLVLGIAGLVATAVAGWLGWTLVQTHHVGIKPTRQGIVEPEPRDEIDDLDELDLPPGEHEHTTARMEIH